MSALFDRDHPPRRHPRGADDDTAELPVPAADTPHHRDHADHPPVDHHRGRLRPTTPARRLQAGLLLGAYAPASLGSAWLLALAFLRLSLPMMILMCGALVWLVPDTVRLARWLGHLNHGAQRPRLSRSQRLVAGLLAATYAYLLVDWLLHQ